MEIDKQIKFYDQQIEILCAIAKTVTSEDEDQLLRLKEKIDELKLKQKALGN